VPPGIVIAQAVPGRFGRSPSGFTGIRRTWLVSMLLDLHGMDLLLSQKCRPIGLLTAGDRLLRDHHNRILMHDSFDSIIVPPRSEALVQVPGSAHSPPSGIRSAQLQGSDARVQPPLDSVPAHQTPCVPPPASLSSQGAGGYPPGMNHPLRLVCFAVVVACSGCATTPEPARPLGVLWRTPSSATAAAAIRPDPTPVSWIPEGLQPRIAYTLSYVEGTLPELAAAGLLDLERPTARVVPVGVVAAQRVRSQDQFLSPPLAVAASGIAICTQLVNDYSYLSGYHLDRGYLVPDIGILEFGNQFTLSGEARAGMVAIDQAEFECCELLAISSYIGHYPVAGVFTSAPWSEPTCLMHEAILTTSGLLLDDHHDLVLPVTTWTDRPSPAVRSLMVSITNPAAEAIPLAVSPRQLLLVIHAHILTSHDQASPPTRWQVLPPQQLISLVPPWHGAGALE
jgi:hypothetical protein